MALRLRSDFPLLAIHNSEGASDRWFNEIRYKKKHSRTTDAPGSRWRSINMFSLGLPKMMSFATRCAPSMPRAGCEGAFAVGMYSVWQPAADGMVLYTRLREAASP